MLSLKSARNILALFRCYTAMPWAYYQGQKPGAGRVYPAFAIEKGRLICFRQRLKFVRHVTFLKNFKVSYCKSLLQNI